MGRVNLRPCSLWVCYSLIFVALHLKPGKVDRQLAYAVSVVPTSRGPTRRSLSAPLLVNRTAVFMEGGRLARRGERPTATATIGSATEKKKIKRKADAEKKKAGQLARKQEERVTLLGTIACLPPSFAEREMALKDQLDADFLKHSVARKVLFGSCVVNADSFGAEDLLEKSRLDTAAARFAADLVTRLWVPFLREHGWGPDKVETVNHQQRAPSCTNSSRGGLGGHFLRPNTTQALNQLTEKLSVELIRKFLASEQVWLLAKRHYEEALVGQGSVLKERVRGRDGRKEVHLLHALIEAEPPQRQAAGGPAKTGTVVEKIKMGESEIGSDEEDANACSEEREARRAQQNEDPLDQNSPDALVVGMRKLVLSDLLPET